MSIWGTVTDYTTGEPVRAATAQDWRNTASKLASGDSDAYTGAWEDEDGTVVYVDGGPDAEVTDRDIAALEQEAVAAGDGRQARLCADAQGEASGHEYMPARLYRVVLHDADLAAFFASPSHLLAANGLKAAIDGADVVLSGAAVNYLASEMTPDDDGYVEYGTLWAGGDPFAIMAEEDTRDYARAECVRVILDARMTVAASA